MTSHVGKFVRRHRSAVLAGIVAVVGAAVLTAAGLTISRSGSARDPSLLGRGALAPRDRIVVTGFDDRTGDPALAAAITDAFRIDLGQSAVVRVLAPGQVRATVDRMQQPASMALNDSLARELALREGVKAIVTGSLARASEVFTVAVQLVAARDGETLVSLRETAADSSQLIAAVDRASKALRRQIGEPLRELETMPRLERATTSSLPALRRFSDAQRLVRLGQRDSAIAQLEAAVARDTGFASAFVSLAKAYDSIGDIGRALAARKHALANQVRLSFLERSFLVASAAFVNEDYATAIRIYADVLARFPDDVRALNNLALACRDSRQFDRAELLFRRAADIDSTIPNFYVGMHSAQVLRGDFARARATLDTMTRRFPDNPVLLAEEMRNAVARQDWASTERIALARIEKAGRDTFALVDPYEALAAVAMARGRVNEAERLWRQQLTLSRAAGALGRHLFGVLQLGYLQLRYQSDTARAVALVDSALRVTAIGRLLPGDRAYYDVARFYIAAGKTGRVRQLLAAAAANDSVLGRASLADRAWTGALLARAERRGAVSLDDLRRAAELHSCFICVDPDLGRAYEDAGRLDDAASAYMRYLGTPWLARHRPDAVELGWVMMRLAEVSMKLGHGDRARRVMAQLRELWRDADPALRPLLETASLSMRP